MLTPEQLEARKGKITASEIGAIAGHGRFATRGDVMRRKVREAHGLENEFQGNVATDWGNEHELDAITEYVFTSGNCVANGRFVELEINGVMCGATPDGFTNMGIIEVKCPYGKRNEQLNAAEYLSTMREYQLQIQWQLLVTQNTLCHFITWTTKGCDYCPVIADDMVQNELIADALEFDAELKAILADHERCIPYLQEKNEYIERTDDEFIALATVYNQLQEMADGWQALADTAKKDLIANCTGNTKAAGLTIYKTERKGAVDYAKIPELCGISLDQYRKKSTTIWTVKPDKE